MLLELEKYPVEEIEAMKDNYKVINVDAVEEAKKAGNNIKPIRLS